MTRLGGDPTISVTDNVRKFFAAAPKLVTLPGVELMEAGMEWPLASGPQTFTADDLLAVVASQDDPAVHAPRLKVGHADGRLDGEPAFGKFINLRVVNDGQTLVGDLTGVPEWLAKIMPTAYPNRSVEGALGLTTATGHKWPLVLTAVALPASATTFRAEAYGRSQREAVQNVRYQCQFARGGTLTGPISTKQLSAERWYAGVPCEDGV